MARRFLTNQLLCGALLASLAYVPTARADDAGSWLSQWLWVDFKKPNQRTGFQLWLDLHERAWGPTFLAIVRPGLGYDVGHGLTLWLGYAFIPSFVAGSTDAPRFEHRIWEQFIANQKVKTVALQGRVRLEQRIRQGADGVGARLRLFGRAGFFFGQQASWGWALWDEVFINLNTTQAWPIGFDQNRVFTGPFFQANNGVRIEFGYMNYLVNRADVGLQDSHIAMMNLFVPLRAFPKPPESKPPEVPPPGLSPPESKPPEVPPPGLSPPEPKPPEPKSEPELTPAPPKSTAISPNLVSDLWDASG